MGRPKAFTEEEVFEALHRCQGVVSYMAQCLNCSRATIYNYIDEYPALKEARDEYQGTNDAKGIPGVKRKTPTQLESQVPENYKEEHLRDWVAANYNKVQNKVGLPPATQLTREYRWGRTRIDLLVVHENKFSIIEVKRARGQNRSGNRGAYQLPGQLAWYQDVISEAHNCTFDNINLVAAIDWAPRDRFWRVVSKLEVDISVLRLDQLLSP